MNEFKTWWGRKFIGFFDRKCDYNRRLRGRNYARTGRVINIKLVGNSTVFAQVEGNDIYNVFIEFPELDGKDIEIIYTYLSSNNYLKRFLLGEFPEEVYNYLEDIGLDIFDFSGVKYRCDCPDNTKFCKHIYAVVYILAKIVEKCPLLLLYLRGMPINSEILNYKLLYELNNTHINVEEYPYKDIKNLNITHVDLNELSNISFNFPKLDIFKVFDYDLFNKKFGTEFRKIYKEIKKVDEYLEDVDVNNVGRMVKFRDKYNKLVKKIKFLLNIDKEELKNYSEEIQFSYFAVRFCLSLIKCGAVIPKLYYIKVGNKKKYLINWEPFLNNEEIKEAYNKLIKDKSESGKLAKKFIISHILNSIINYIYSKTDVKVYFPHILKILDMFFYSKRVELDNETLINLYLFTESVEPRFSIKIEKTDIGFLREIEVDDSPLSLSSLYGYRRLFKKEFDDILNNPIIGDEEFYNFLFKKIPKMMNYGIKIILPKNVVMPKIKVDVKTTTVKHYFSFEDALVFNYKIVVGDEEVDLNEFIKMVKDEKGFVKFKDKYIILNEKILKKIKRLKNKKSKISLLFTEDEDIEINLEEKVKELLNKFHEFKDVELPELNIKLRNYQIDGFKFLYKNISTGFGCLLADDMGLGKTVQTIAVIKKLLEEGKKYILIIVPTALITNWLVELKKFGNLEANIIHSSNIKEGINITTYGIVRKYINNFTKVEWDLVVLDEAQNIKNPNAKQTKAVKKLKAKGRIALTGTPIENRLTDFWSIFDFLNKGYLGSLREFKEEFAKPIEINKDKKVLKTFKKMISPFVLRREKTDNNIIKELPSKIRINKYASLTKEQIVLYKSCLNEIMEKVEKSEGIERKGWILKLILNLKQICNHPSLYLKDNNHNPKRSGKSMLLLDILENIYENNEKALIFTQYREMGNILKEMLKERFDEEVLFYHGGLNRKQRDEIIDKFKEKGKFLILTYKAGGFGLNLTEANNIIHYDLWWNPSVERQGEDRSYRIGQEKDVIVYRLITSNTFEEKIDNILKEKEELYNLAMVSGGKFILDMSPKELKELFKLRV